MNLGRISLGKTLGKTRTHAHQHTDKERDKYSERRYTTAHRRAKDVEKRYVGFR